MPSDDVNENDYRRWTTFEEDGSFLLVFVSLIETSQKFPGGFARQHICNKRSCIHHIVQIFIIFIPNELAHRKQERLCWR